ncbi:hypothetical protein [Companilactobacillus sp. HBUAS56257]|uniref:hypothetical protein n=1 Tax=Companilactobacillus sp. HBUAS56257 TaxID=3109360 RepID=UPI002FF10B80
MKKISKTIEQILVDGLRKGYIDFLEELAKRRESMLTSSGWLWTRSNFVDTAIGKALSENKVGDYEKFTSGAWEFLRFQIPLEDEKNTWIVQKTVNYVYNNANFQGTKDQKQNFISDWGNQVNEKNSKKSSDKLGQIDLFDSSSNIDRAVDASEFNNVDSFLLLTYSIAEDKNINDIKLNLIYDRRITLIENLNDINAASDVKIPDELYSKLNNMKVIDPKEESFDTYDYYSGVNEKKDTKQNKQ